MRISSAVERPVSVPEDVSEGGEFIFTKKQLKFTLILSYLIKNPTANTSVVVVSTRHRTTFYSTTSFMHQHEHNCHY